MNTVNLNKDNWALVDAIDLLIAQLTDPDNNRSINHSYNGADISALCDYISNANTDDFCDINNYEYTH